MHGPDDKPLLVLSRQGEGRVALLLSDHIWLWARGYEGGGPHLDLLRRLSHWLMKQPDLEEEALRLSSHGRELTIERQTMADTVDAVTVTSPSGQTRTVTLGASEPGIWRANVPAGELGLWRATDGKLTALTNIGPANPREFAEVTSTADVVGPLARRLLRRGRADDRQRGGPFLHAGRQRLEPDRLPRGLRGRRFRNVARLAGRAHVLVLGADLGALPV